MNYLLHSGFIGMDQSGVSAFTATRISPSYSTVEVIVI
jgi:hypothetical protein